MGANAGAVQAGQSYIEMFLDRAAAVKGLQDFENRVRRTGAALSRINLGGFSSSLQSSLAGALTKGVKSIASGQFFVRAFDSVALGLGSAVNAIFNPAFFNRLGKQFQAVGGKLFFTGGTGALAFGSITALLAKPIQAFSDFEQKMGRFQQVFKDLTPRALEFSKKLAGDVRNSVVNVADEMTSFQALLRGMKFSPEEALHFAKAMTIATEDMAAFFNETQVESMDRLRSGINGMIRPVQAFGANVRVANLHQILLDKGINKTSKDLSLYQRALINIGIIQDAIKDTGIGGQALREVNMLASLFRGLTAAAYDANVALGETLAPAISALSLNLIGGLKAATDWIKEHKAIVALGLLVPPALTAASVSVAALGIALYAGGVAVKGFAAPLRLLAASVSLAKAAFLGASAVIGGFLVVLGASGAAFSSFLGGMAAIGRTAGGVVLLTRNVSKLLSTFTDLGVWVSSIGIRAFGELTVASANTATGILRKIPVFSVLRVSIEKMAKGAISALLAIPAATRSTFQWLGFLRSSIGGLSGVFASLAVGTSIAFKSILKSLYSVVTGSRVLFYTVRTMQLLGGATFAVAKAAATMAGALSVAFAWLTTSISLVASSAFLLRLGILAVRIPRLGGVVNRLAGTIKVLGEAFVASFGVFAKILGQFAAATIIDAIDAWKQLKRTFVSLVQLGSSGFVALGRAMANVAAGSVVAAKNAALFTLSLVKMGAGAAARAVISGLTAIASVFVTVASAAVTGLAYLAAGVASVVVPLGIAVLISGALAKAFVKLVDATHEAYRALGGLQGIFSQIFGSAGGFLQEIGASLREAFGNIRTELFSMWRAISAAVASGDLLGAFQVLWAGIKLEFARGRDALAAHWASIRTTALTAINGMWRKLVEIFQTGYENIRLYGDQFNEVFKTLWDSAKSIATSIKGALDFSGSDLTSVWDDQRSAILNVAATIEFAYLDAIRSVKQKWIEFNAAVALSASKVNEELNPFSKDSGAEQRAIASKWLKDTQAASHEFDTAIAAGEKRRADMQRDHQARLDAARKSSDEAAAARQAKINGMAGKSEAAAAEALDQAEQNFAEVFDNVLGRALRAFGGKMPNGKDLAEGIQNVWDDVMGRLGFMKEGDKGGKVSFRRTDAMFADQAFAGGALADLARQQLRVQQQIERNTRAQPGGVKVRLGK